MKPVIPYNPEIPIEDYLSAGNAIDFSGQDLSGMDLSNLDLSFCFFEDTNCHGVSFKNSKLIHADFTGANLCGADFTGADLSKAFMSGVSMDEEVIGRGVI